MLPPEPGRKLGAQLMKSYPYIQLEGRVEKPPEMFDREHEWSGKVVGPHFEQICREWTLHHANPDRLGGLPARVGHGQVHDPRASAGHQLDVAVMGVTGGGKPPRLAIGEAKCNDVLGAAHIEPLLHIRTSSPPRGGTTRAGPGCCTLAAQASTTRHNPPPPPARSS